MILHLIELIFAFCGSYPVYEGAGESFAPMDLNQDALVQDLDGEESAVVAEIVAAAESTLGLQKGVLEVGDDGVQSGEGLLHLLDASVNVRRRPLASGWFLFVLGFFGVVAGGRAILAHTDLRNKGERNQRRR